MPAFRDELDALAPWDAIPYFEEPTESAVSVINGQLAPLAGANVRRVGLIFHVAGNGTVNVGIKPAANVGITCASTLPPTEIRFADYGTLCQKAWQAFNPGAQPVVVTVYEVVLLRWPRASDDTTGSNSNGTQVYRRKRKRAGG